MVAAVPNDLTPAQATEFARAVGVGMGVLGAVLIITGWRFPRYLRAWSRTAPDGRPAVRGLAIIGGVVALLVGLRLAVTGLP
jgi:hypothetical protein